MKFLRWLWRKVFPKKEEPRIVSLSGDISLEVRRGRLRKRQRMCAEMGKRNGQLY